MTAEQVKMNVGTSSDKMQCPIPRKIYKVVRRNDGQGSSTMNGAARMHRRDDYLSLVQLELSENEINVQNLGKLIADGILNEVLSEGELDELAKIAAKNLGHLGNIDIVNLATCLNKGTIDSRYVVIGNSFLWNVVKSGMTSVRDKFDNFNFKVCSMNDSQQINKAEMNSKNVGNFEFVVHPEGLFQETDLMEIFQNITFRKGADIQKKAKKIVKSYLVRATHPKCAIWHYGLRLSGSSHKKTIQDFPTEIAKTLIDFMIALTGLFVKELELEYSDLGDQHPFIQSLGDTFEQRKEEFYNLKNYRNTLTGKFRITIAEALNEVREMPFNIRSRELQAPPRGKPMDPDCVTWKQYEELIKRCVENPSSENLKEKERIEVQLEYDALGEEGDDGEEGEDEEEDEEEEESEEGQKPYGNTIEEDDIVPKTEDDVKNEG